MDAFAAQSPALPLAVALSGGADSTALLLACAARWPGQIEAWHVHHGLQAAADDFERHCAALCQRLGVPLHVRRVDARAAAGQSPEDAARRHRYQSFDALALAKPAREAIKTVVIAQHADDQVETMLLALSRGAGLPGLAAMPARWRRGGVDYARPLLDVPGAVIRAWLRARGESWVEDPTNADERLTRNRIRARLLPALDAVFPAFRATFARSARHAAEAQAILNEVAAQDLAVCGQPPRLKALQALPAPRRANVLRHWLGRAHAQTPSSAQLAELQSQIVAATTRGHRIGLKVGNGQVQRQGDVVVWVPAARAAEAVPSAS
ncbi:tRNA lysidine(34) synthetase TilS [Ottowia testudinis]|uniref:tRNA(Ile)-lysidine synthase n=1 Tax=Ottowia testudinis TaxID=2816950 RepID=A0A975CKH4_9BURK|nr:tRNA lysidine(34) synthetase TilS [Ottowia testudinis]QTD47274.1 tRNA lysidine(34) synthetase TilS [Ottowia testudinis]